MISVEFRDLAISDLPDELRDLLFYWHEIRHERLAPAWQDFDMMKIPAQHLPLTMVKDVEKEPHAYRYRFYGTGFVRLNSKDLTGKTTDDIAMPTFAQALRVSLDDFVKQDEPRFYEVKFLHRYHDHVGQHLFRLPLSDDGATINRVVAIAVKHLDLQHYHDLIEAEEGNPLI
ncbi:MAG: PAS domain-containing protein [Rhodospirillaceae bacterium]|jgi:hypothetical protein|nr:PAS domain-containing protein [Rhodospirillaceae bacterium]